MTLALKLPGLGLARRPNLESTSEEIYPLLAKLASVSLASDGRWQIVVGVASTSVFFFCLFFSITQLPGLEAL